MRLRKPMYHLRNLSAWESKALNHERFYPRLGSQTSFLQRYQDGLSKNPCCKKKCVVKAYAKAQGFDKSYDPYKAAYGSMPSHASANPEIKQLYINGHF